MDASKNGIFISFLLYIVHIFGLVQLPEVEDNNILSTDTAIRDTVNKLFSTLRIKDVKRNPILKEYSIVHNHLISFTLQDYNNLKEIAKLTRVDKKNTNNETENFINALNDLLNEDIEIEHNDNKDDVVTNHIEQFLITLDQLKKENGVNSERFRVKEAVYNILKETEVSSYNDTRAEANFNLSDNEDSLLGENYFWRPESSFRRVYRGKRVKIKYFPFMASIQMFNQFYCGGSIIKNDLVITASSCLQLAYNNRLFRENPAFLSVRVGTTFYDAAGENIAVLEVYFHPEYNPKTLRNNICVLRLVRKINLKKKKVKKIKLDPNASPLPLTTDGITIIGWGAKGSNNKIMDPWHQQLSYAVLDIYPLQECQEVYSKEYVTKKNFCAGFFSKGGGACNRDVGGPGVVDGVLMGVVSFGSPVCGTPDAPTVFTKVGYYTDWIEDIMEQEVATGWKQTTIMPLMNYYTIPNHTMVPKTTFKIPPLKGTLKPVPIQEVDALRMLRNSKLFQEFLETMFGSEEKIGNQDLLQKSKESEAPDKDFTLRPMTMPLHEEQIIESYTKMVSPPDIIPEYPYVTDIPEVATKKESTIVKISKDAELEKDLVDLIDNIDLKKIIDNMSSLEQDKIIEDSKLLDMFGQTKIDETKLANVDDRVLTLLYLSDSEKKPQGQNVGDFTNSDGEKEEMGREKGLSIDSAPFKDLTFKNKNSSKLYHILPKQQLYGLLSENINFDAEYK